MKYLFWFGLVLSLTFTQNIVQAKSVNGLECTSLSPELNWAPVKGANGYKVTLKKLDNSGRVSTTLGPFSTEESSYTSEVLSAGIYKVIVKAKGTNAKKLVLYIQAKSSSSSTNFITVQAQEFLPKTSMDDYEFEISDGQFFAELAGAPVTEIDISAAVQLPDGVQLTKVEVYYKNVGAASSIVLYRRQNSSGSAESITTSALSLSGTGEQSKSTTAFQSGRSVVDNDNYIYFIDIIDLTNTDLIHRVNIYYQ